MRKFRMGDRVVVNSNFTDQDELRIKRNLKPGDKLVITNYYDQQICKVIINSGIEIGQITYINVDKIDLDTQFYREKRLKKLLDR